jgi:hypothetical protein
MPWAVMLRPYRALNVMLLMEVVNPLPTQNSNVGFTNLKSDLSD